MQRQHHRNRRRIWVALVVPALLVLVVACSSSPKALITPETTTTSQPVTTEDTLVGLQPPPNFQVPDTRNAVLLPVRGRPAGAPEIPVRGGSATVSGTVSGPDGPVGGATVRIERFVGLDSGSIDVTADGSGHYGEAGLLGGRFKVRAWSPPSLATFNAATGFVADGQILNLDVSLEKHDAGRLQVASARGQLVVGDQSTVRVLVTQEAVDGDGIVVSGAQAGVPVRLSPSAEIRLDSANPTVTGGDGIAEFTVTCLSSGSHGVSASTPSLSGSGTLPDCVDRAAPTTTTPTVDVPPFPVGQSFSVPAQGPFPAGTYQGQATCSVIFEVFVDGGWQPRQSSGADLAFLGPARHFANADPVAPTCTYTRTK